MYKVKDAADQLGVSRVEIFEILLSRREEFSPYVVKNNSITYVTDEGLAILKKMLFPHDESDEIETPKEVENDSQLGAKEESNKGVIEIQPEEVALIDDTEEETLFERLEESIAKEAVKGSDVNFNEEIEHIQELIPDDLETAYLPLEEGADTSDDVDDDDLAGQWLKEIQIEDEQASKMDSRLKELRTQVAALRNKILVLDSEINRKDEAIRHYHDIMKDDVSWLEDIEHKIINIAENSRMNDSDVVGEVNEENTEKPAFFKLFRR